MKKSFKKTAAAVCCALTALIMTGCAHIGIDVEINSDGTASATGTYAIQNDYYSDGMFEGYEIKTYSFNGNDYTGYDYSEDFDTYAELASNMTGNAFKEFSVEKSGNPFVYTYTFDGVFANLMGDESTDYSEYSEMASSMMDVSFTMKLPGNVTECTGGTVDDDGVISFDINPNAETVCYAVSKEVNVPLIAGAAAAAVIIIAIIIVIAVKFKKKPADKITYDDLNPDDKIM